MGEVTSTRFLGNAEALREEFIRLTEWAERIVLCVPGLNDRDEHECPIWSVLCEHARKVEHLFCSAWDVDLPDLEPFFQRAAVKMLNDPWQQFLTNAAWFERQDEIALIVASSRFGPDLFKQSALVSAIVYQGRRDCDLAHRFLGHIDEWLNRSRLATNLDDGGNVGPLAPSATGIAALELLRTEKEIEQTHQTFLALFREAVRHEGRCVQELSERRFRDDFFELETRIGHTESSYRFQFINRDALLPVHFSVTRVLNGELRGAAYARDPRTERLYLVSTGRISRGLGPLKVKRFWHLTRYRPVHVLNGQEKEVRVAIVCEVGVVEQLEHLAAFTQEASRIMESHEPEKPSQVFFGLTIEDRIAKVYQHLLGHGAVTMDDAIRVVAKGLRDENLLKYQTLRQTGEIYKGIYLVIQEGSKVKWGSLRRIPKKKIMAIKPNAGDFTTEEWNRCVIRTIRENTGQRLCEEEIIRKSAEHARDRYGLQYQRLASNMNIWKSLEEAVARALEGGLLEFDKGEYQLLG